MASIFEVKTAQRVELIDVTSRVQQAVTDLGLSDGVAWVFVPHTTAAITINEGADPDVAHDVVASLNGLIPFEAGYKHDEGNSSGHIKSILVGSSVWVPVTGSRLALGTWQSIFFCEFDGPRVRRVQVRGIAEAPTR